MGSQPPSGNVSTILLADKNSPFGFDKLFVREESIPAIKVYPSEIHYGLIQENTSTDAEIHVLHDKSKDVNIDVVPGNLVQDIKKQVVREGYSMFKCHFVWKSDSNGLPEVKVMMGVGPKRSDQDEISVTADVFR